MPARDVEETLFILVTQVARVEPAARQRLGIRLGVLGVAGEHGGAAHADLLGVRRKFMGTQTAPSLNVTHMLSNRMFEMLQRQGREG
jgi:hypothetical protein